MPGSLIHSPADIIRKLLIDLGLGTAASASGSWPVYCDYMPTSPDNLICAVDTTGVHQGRIMIDGEVEERHGVQIIVRSYPVKTGYTKARAITVALDAALKDSVTIDSSDYLVHAISRSSGPIALGKETDENTNVASKRDIFTINVTVSVRQSS